LQIEAEETSNNEPVIAVISVCAVSSAVVSAAMLEELSVVGRAETDVTRPLTVLLRV